jgi:DeoR/GlpR family transcriptional regulator of sugar metabolism
VDQGLMNDSVPEILTDRALRRMARSVVVIADASKFEHVEPGFVFGLEEVDILVTDESAAPATLDAVRERGVQVLVAPALPGEAATAAAAQLDAS